MSLSPSRWAVIKVVLMLGSITSCAGPMSPFGAKGLPPVSASSDLMLGNDNSNKRDISSLTIPKSNATIEFYPNYQSFHAGQDLSVIIHDPKGVILSSEIKFLYGDEDVGQKWRDYAKKEFSNDGRTLTLTMPKIRFLAGLDKRFVVAYRQRSDTPYSIGVLRQPICPIYELAAIRNPKAYPKSASMIGTIERSATELGINPNLLAGLVAQESGYNPKAVSVARALGLTQVTDAAGEHVLEKLTDAKSYEGISSMSYPELLLKIYSGEINAENEWRLNPSESLKGGLHYLNFLRDYWQSEENNRELTGVFAGQVPWEDIILASYNSGPYRVKTAMRSHGKNWPYHPKLSEARKYVSKVRSYCQSFAGLPRGAL